eukprot:2326465-Alexandrium_andersonii.AAC.1
MPPMPPSPLSNWSAPPSAWGAARASSGPSSASARPAAAAAPSPEGGRQSGRRSPASCSPRPRPAKK